MAASQIIECFRNSEKHFSAVVVTDGRGSPRDGEYAAFSDTEMADIRKDEQEAAARIGRYSACLQLCYQSSTVKSMDKKLIEDIKNIIIASSPNIILTHNLSDKHDTHVATALAVIASIRDLPSINRPKQIIGMEVWRGLDWLDDTEKAVFDTSTHQGLQQSLLGVFDSQVAGGKRYDLAAMGRRVANATFFASHSTDKFDSTTYGIDMTEMIYSGIDPSIWMVSKINNFAEDVKKRIESFKR